MVLPSKKVLLTRMKKFGEFSRFVDPDSGEEKEAWMEEYEDFDSVSG